MAGSSRFFMQKTNTINLRFGNKYVKKLVQLTDYLKKYEKYRTGEHNGEGRRNRSRNNKFSGSSP